MSTRRMMVKSGVSLMLALITVLLVAAPAMGKDKDDERLTVIAHVPLPGAPVSRMFLQEEHGKQYLYIQQPSKEGFTIVDVSKPNKPNVIKRTALPNTSTNGKLQMVGNGLAISETPENTSGAASEPAAATKPKTAPPAAHPPQSVKVLDMSDPANPKTLKTFENVTNVLPDDGRHLIYITNNEGLWILRHKQQPQMKLCDSESVFSPIADCY